jgi:Flp pilus assembly protein TadD
VVASRVPRPLARLAPVETTPPAPLVEPAPRSEPAAPPAAAAPPTPSALANETALLSAALTRLRHDRDAAGALAALDVYDARAPHGTLRREANVARVDALLMLGRDADALAVLRTLPLQPRGREQELRVVRGELIAPSSCAAAVEDFDHVLTGAPPAPLVERALHGRATCLTKLGDLEGARRDSLEYLRRFPEGRFAAQARRLTGENDL